MANADIDQAHRSAALSFDDDGATEISNASQLREALGRLPTLSHHQQVILRRGPKHYVKATRQGAFWSVSVRCGGFWTCQSFDAGSTAEFSARQIRKSRKAATFWGRFTGWDSGVSGLSDNQVESIFLSFFLGSKFSVPFAGA